MYESYRDADPNNELVQVRQQVEYLTSRLNTLTQANEQMRRQLASLGINTEVRCIGCTD